MSPRAWIRLVVDALCLRGDVDSVPSVSTRQLLSSTVVTALDFSVFYLLVKDAPQPAAGNAKTVIVAAVVAFLLALVTSYLLSAAYVYRQLTAGKIRGGREFLVFTVCAAFSLLLTVSLIWLLAVAAGVPPLVAKAIVVVALFFWNQWMARHIIFKQKKG
ncbi:MAG: GtrA family protein [Planctomycetes bacterium]|nr:GtrA family protein [Planctomycetota bacterium]